MSEPLPSDVTKALPTQRAAPAVATHLDPEQTQSHAPDTHLSSPDQPATVSELPTIPGFEIRGVLGHGGMGVVYHAWQINLKRNVALKMILSGDHAGPHHVARFRTEAQAVAQLQHPHIVQIYEVGEHKGRPFFCMEYVDGGSLARKLDHHPQPPEHAARLVEMLARAVHYTHQRGIVHRDLKPANVLLQTVASGQWPVISNTPASSPGTDHWSLTTAPKITDFGLAKQLTEDGGQTMSGAVLGTPNYMAPEQAAGKTHDVGPPADVYALGAILYEMLTGRPPFRGESHGDTLHQVVHIEPEPPSRIVAQVPRDLETVCLKALAKEPARRYASALALAQDLERFVAGEPILARREGVVRRAWRKLRRNPRTVASAVVVVLALAAVVFFFGSARSSARLADFANNFEPRLQKVEWSAEYLDDMGKLIADIEPLHPDRARAARDELYRQYEKSIQHALRLNTTLTAEDIGKIAEALDLLKTRHAELEAALRKELGVRTGVVQAIAHLEPPFDGVAEVIPDHRFTKTAKVLYSPFTSDHDNPIVPLSKPSQGSVQMEAAFAYPSWGKAHELGLAFNVAGSNRQSQSGKAQAYTFLLGAARASPNANSKEKPATLDFGRGADGQLLLKIQRNGVTLRKANLPPGTLAAGPMALKATREGNLLTLELFQERTLKASLRFRDTFTLGNATRSYFGLVWPVGVGLESLSLSSQTLPPLSGPLERADQFLAMGEVEEARVLYHEQSQASDDATVRQEARCKEARCLIELKRFDEAGNLLAPLVNERGDSWPLVAACELWLVYLQQLKRAEADLLADTLLSRGYQPEQLAAVISDDVRSAIWQSVNEEFTVYSFLLRAGELRIRNLERITELHDYLQDSTISKFYMRLRLLRGLRIVGQSAKAEGLLQKWLTQEPHLAVKIPAQRIMFLEELGWLARDLGHPQQVIPVIDHHLREYVQQTEYARLLVERARLHIALGDWEGAERDLEQFFKSVQPGSEYYAYASACLIQGFLRQRRGDLLGAQEAWSRKMPSPKSDPGRSLTDPANVSGGGMAVVHSLILAALTDQISEAEAAAHQERLLSLVPADYRTAINTVGLRLPASLLRDMWLTPRGLASAQHLAYHDVPLADYLKLPILVAVSAKMRSDALPPRITMEQDDLVWNVADDVWAALRASKLSQANTVQMAFAWKGTSNFLGWGGLAPSLEPSLRGPLAYVMGHRFERLGKRDQAVELFRTAEREATADSVLLRLAKTELKRMEAK